MQLVLPDWPDGPWTGWPLAHCLHRPSALDRPCQQTQCMQDLDSQDHRHHHRRCGC
ncbi:hypothetical protein BC831DRAFT_475251 [Entophlyctis helioformis]|nr:hypothetical protein BC831DRAFT_475251 [Entophlyctis helioformis]